MRLRPSGRTTRRPLPRKRSPSSDRPDPGQQERGGADGGRRGPEGPEEEDAGAPPSRIGAHGEGEEDEERRHEDEVDKGAHATSMPPGPFGHETGWWAGPSGCRIEAWTPTRSAARSSTTWPSRGHVVIPRAPLIPDDDPTTLFTGSGMQPLLPYLLGADHPAGRRLADSQTCLRVQDIEEVGDNRHTTFFEMLGNWSLGDYFKDEQLPQFWDFLTEKVGLDPAPDLRLLLHRRRGHTASRRTTESAAIWTRAVHRGGRLGRPGRARHRGARGRGRHRRGADRLLRQEELVVPRRQRGAHAGRRAGRPGLRGLLPLPAHRARPGLRRALPPELRLRPVHRARQLGVHGVPAAPRPASSRCPASNVDYGGGLARIAAASIDTPDVFRINLLWPIIERLEELSGRTYEDETRRHAGHRRPPARGDVPGRRRRAPEQQGAGLRDAPAGPPGRPLRRSTSASRRTSSRTIIPTVAGIYSGAYPEVAAAADEVAAVLVEEEQVFRRTLRHGHQAAGGSPGDGRHRCGPVRALRHLRLPGRAVHRGGAHGGHRRQRHVA